MQSVIPPARPAARRPSALVHLLLVGLASMVLLAATAWLVPPAGSSTEEGPRGAPFRWVTIARGVA